jgi:hypothetical protein
MNKLLRECCWCKKSYWILEKDNIPYEKYICQSCLMPYIPAKSYFPNYEQEAKMWNAPDLNSRSSNEDSLNKGYEGNQK